MDHTKASFPLVCHHSYEQPPTPSAVVALNSVWVVPCPLLVQCLQIQRGLSARVRIEQRRPSDGPGWPLDQTTAIDHSFKYVPSHVFQLFQPHKMLYGFSKREIKTLPRSPLGCPKLAVENPHHVSCPWPSTSRHKGSNVTSTLRLTPQIV